MISAYQKRAETQLLERDGCTCMITKDPRQAPVHIIPPNLFNKHKSDQRNPDKGTNGGSMWAAFSAYMAEDEQIKFEKVFKQLTSGQLEPCENYLLLAEDIISDWRDGVFALKPVHVTADKRRMTLQVVLSGQDCIDIDGTLDALHEFKDTRGILQIQRANSPGVFKLANTMTGVQYKNGDIFDVTTNDPVTRPLHNRTLLELKFWWSRLLGTLQLRPDLDSDDEEDEDRSGYDESDDDDDYDKRSIDSRDSEGNPISVRLSGGGTAFCKCDDSSSEDE